LLVLVGGAMRGKGCSPFGSDLRVATPSGLYTYPDVSVICGRVELDPGRPDTATNPVLLVEVLSDATRDYDRGEKFELYKAIPTLREYLLVDPSRVLVEQHERSADGTWRVRMHENLDDVVRLESVPVELPLREVYRELFGG
jgi:Uma2 family endonuclease